MRSLCRVSVKYQVLIHKLAFVLSLKNGAEDTLGLGKGKEKKKYLMYVSKADH